MFIEILFKAFSEQVNQFLKLHCRTVLLAKVLLTLSQTFGSNLINPVFEHIFRGGVFITAKLTSFGIVISSLSDLFFGLIKCI